MATQIISRLRGAFRIELPLRVLFENPTIAELAMQITGAQAKKAAPEEMADALPIRSRSSDEETERLLDHESSEAI